MGIRYEGACMPVSHALNMRNRYIRFGVDVGYIESAGHLVSICRLENVRLFTFEGFDVVVD